MKLQVFTWSDKWKLQALRCWGKRIFADQQFQFMCSFYIRILPRVREWSLQVSPLKENTLKRSRKQKPGQGMPVQGDVQGKGHYHPCWVCVGVGEQTLKEKPMQSLGSADASSDWKQRSQDCNLVEAPLLQVSHHWIQIFASRFRGTRGFQVAGTISACINLQNSTLFFKSNLLLVWGHSPLVQAALSAQVNLVLLAFPEKEPKEKILRKQKHKLRRAIKMRKSLSQPRDIIQCQFYYRKKIEKRKSHTWRDLKPNRASWNAGQDNL